ncbi:hypothetical protein M0802_008315 [Mischocyttarus mexicanus]|nr:hypothetical protein M0802_008315 [Mischocyttarus mexicanus]
MNPNSFGLLMTCLPNRAAPTLQYHASKDKLNHGPSCHPQNPGPSPLDRCDVTLSIGEALSVSRRLKAGGCHATMGPHGGDAGVPRGPAGGEGAEKEREREWQEEDEVEKGKVQQQQQQQQQLSLPVPPFVLP